MQNAPIWVPPGSFDRAAKEVSKAVREYDERLGFGRNEDTGQWCIFMRQGTTEETRGGDLPILGFNDIPSRDEALRRLHQSDARRRGTEILDQLNRHNEEINKRFTDAADDAIGETAEAMEWFNRQLGQHPSPRVFIPRGVDDGV